MNSHLIDITIVVLSGWCIYRGFKNGLRGIIIGIIKAAALSCIIVIILSKTPVALIQNEVKKNIITVGLLKIIPQAYIFISDNWNFKYKETIGEFLEYKETTLQ